MVVPINSACVRQKAAELEYGRAGGKLGGSEVDHRFPDLVALLGKVTEERNARLKRVGSGSTERDVPPDADPRMKRLKAMGQA